MGTLGYIVLLPPFLILGNLFAQEQESLKWTSERKLGWVNFKGKPEERQSVAALTASGISYQFSTKMQEEGEMRIDFKVESYFYPNKSWVQPALADSTILGHEQLHFDISEVFARKMGKRLEVAHFSENVRNEVKAIYASIIKELNAFQNRYDNETNFSRNKEQQLFWERKIKMILASE